MEPERPFGKDDLGWDDLAGPLSHRQRVIQEPITYLLPDQRHCSWPGQDIGDLTITFAHTIIKHLLLYQRHSLAGHAWFQQVCIVRSV